MITFHWHTEPLLLLTVVGALWLYLLAVGPFREAIHRQSCPGEPTPPLPWRHLACFVAGLIIGYLTVGSPLDQIGEDYLFWVHMVQHELLMYVVPPLLILGIPGWLADWVLSPRLLRGAWRFFARPFVAGLLLTLIFTIWHVPVLYEAALHNKVIHVLEHWSLFLPALGMWWAFIGPGTRVPPLHPGAQMLFVFVLMVGQLPVFGFLVLGGEAFYPTYIFAARMPGIFGIDPFQDQVLGGVIMKVWNMAVSLGLFGYAWYRWNQSSQNTPPPELRQTQPSLTSTAGATPSA